MYSKKQIGFFISCIFFYSLHSLSAQTAAISNFDFIRQNIQDILYVLSEYNKVPIVPDDTVSGIASFQFAGTDFNQAFDSFLSLNRLYVKKTDTLWTVSKIRLSTDESGLLHIDGLDITPAQLLDKISAHTRRTIIHDIIPSTQISIHIENASVEEAVKLIMKSFSDYLVEAEETYIYIKKNIHYTPPAPVLKTDTITIRETGGLYEVNAEQASLADILEALFSNAQKEYSSFIKGDILIDRMGFSGKTFEESLRLILEQANGEYTEINGIWYIFQVQQTEILKKLRDTGKRWERFDLKYVTMKDISPLISARFHAQVILELPGGRGFLTPVTEVVSAELRACIAIIDHAKQGEAITLKYIKTEDLFKNLPPSVTRDNLIDTGTGNTVFFTGSADSKKIFLKELEVIDRPQTCIRYDLLILQYQKTSNLKWGTSIDARPVKPGDMSMITGSLGGLLSLNFDVITVFGYMFAAKINTALSENQANVFADTTLYGISGQKIKFQNTSTYRYRDSNIDPKTGKPVYTGVTREIISGLVLDINGWVSGDGMITIDITASVSKRGADVSNASGNPPPTSEKIITTQIRARSGEPVILSGLTQNDSSIVEERIPFISRIPLIGMLFRNKTKTNENSEMVIYLVPHIDSEKTGSAPDRDTVKSAYTRLVLPFMGEYK